MPGRLILQVFKVIALSMVLVFAADIAIYLFKAFQLQQRMDSLAVSIQKVVMQNNYLPESEHAMYNAIFEQIGLVMNGRNKDTEEKIGRERTDADLDNFMIKGQDDDGKQSYVIMNYCSDVSRTCDIQAAGGGTGTNNMTISISSPSGGTDVIYDAGNPRCSNLATPADYGELKYIQLSVTLKQPVWGFAQSGTVSRHWTNNSRGFFDHPTTTMYFSYMVPCLHYNAIT